jgi:hypothetical protein
MTLALMARYLWPVGRSDSTEGLVVRPSSMEWPAKEQAPLEVIATRKGVHFRKAGSAGALPVSAYGLLLISLLITAFTSVLNDHVLKNSGASLHGINSLLYAFGSSVNVLMLFTSGVSPANMFVGFGSLSALACLMCNALIGIAVSAVYKYADAVVKTLATAVAEFPLAAAKAADWQSRVILITPSAWSIFS